MPMHRTIDKNFFKEWFPEMAYVLGFFAADGNMICGKRGNHYISFYSCDREIIVKIRAMMGSNHKISMQDRGMNTQKCYRIQIGNKQIFDDLLRLGMVPNKSNVLNFPNVPDLYLEDFVRGYFDGDGCVSLCRYWRSNRKKWRQILQTNFVSGSQKFLRDLKKRLRIEALLQGGSLYFSSGAWRLLYNQQDSIRLAHFMYNQSPKEFCMIRKRQYFQKALMTLN